VNHTTTYIVLADSEYNPPVANPETVPSGVPRNWTTSYAVDGRISGVRDDPLMHAQLVFSRQPMQLLGRSPALLDKQAHSSLRRHLARRLHSAEFRHPAFHQLDDMLNHALGRIRVVGLAGGVPMCLPAPPPVTPRSVISASPGR